MKRSKAVPRASFDREGGTVYFSMPDAVRPLAATPARHRLPTDARIPPPFMTSFLSSRTGVAAVLVLALLALASPRPLQAQFSDVFAPDRLQEGADAAFYAIWDGRERVDGVLLTLPPGWRLREAAVLRFGYEEVPVRPRALAGASSVYVLPTPRLGQSPAEFVLGVTPGAAAPAAAWQLTPYVELEDGSRVPMDDLGAVRRVRVEATPPTAGQVLAFGAGAAPLLLDARALPPLDGVAPFTLAFWLRTTGRGEVLVSTWDGDERRPYPLELVVDVSGRLRAFRGAHGRHHTLSSRSPVADGRWRHVALTQDPAAGWARLYVDGTAVDSLRLDAEHAAYPSPGRVAVGGFLPETQRTHYAPFSGRLDDLVLAPGVRSVPALVRGGAAASQAPEGTVYLSFDAASEGSAPTRAVLRLPDRVRRVASDRVPPPVLEAPRVALRGTDVVLDWDGPAAPGVRYVVERSTDGRDFGEAGAVAPLRAEDCRFVDVGVTGEVLYYRLRRLQPDGADVVSPTIKMGVAPELDGGALLQGNFPNPFSTRTTVAFELPEADHVRLSVWDLAGQQVALLADGMRSAGYHEVAFAPRDLPSGTYFVRLEAGGAVRTKQMILAK